MNNNKIMIEVTNFFDVWGNKREGWEVNNQCHDYYIVKSFDFYNRSNILRFLKQINFLRKSVRLASLSWEEGDSEFFLDQSSNGCPVCAVRLIFDPSDLSAYADYAREVTK